MSCNLRENLLDVSLWFYYDYWVQKRHDQPITCDKGTVGKQDQLIIKITLMAWASVTKPTLSFRRYLSANINHHWQTYLDADYKSMLWFVLYKPSIYYSIFFVQSNGILVEKIHLVVYILI